MTLKETVPSYRKIPHLCVFCKRSACKNVFHHQKDRISLENIILSTDPTTPQSWLQCAGAVHYPVSQYFHKYMLWVMCIGILRQGQIYPRSLYLPALCLFPAMAPASWDLLLRLFFFCELSEHFHVMGFFREAVFLRHWWYVWKYDA